MTCEGKPIGAGEHPVRGGENRPLDSPVENTVDLGTLYSERRDSNQNIPKERRKVGISQKCNYNN